MLLRKVLGFQTLSSRVKELWQLDGRYKILDLGHDYFVFKFKIRRMMTVEMVSR